MDKWPLIFTSRLPSTTASLVRPSGARSTASIAPPSPKLSEGQTPAQRGEQLSRFATQRCSKCTVHLLLSPLLTALEQQEPLNKTCRDLSSPNHCFCTQHLVCAQLPSEIDRSMRTSLEHDAHDPPITFSTGPPK